MDPYRGSDGGETELVLVAGEHTGLLSNDEKERSRMTGEFDDDDEDSSELQDEADTPEDISEMQKLHDQAARAREHEETVLDRLAVAQELVERIKGELHYAHTARQHAEAKVSHHKHRRHHQMPVRSGPLEWVDSSKFSFFCTSVVVLNLVFMVEHGSISPAMAKFLDNVFLLWYGTELALKFSHHSWSLFFGPPMAVGWNWLDACIVASGVLDQWMAPILLGSATSLAPLRMLRLFRLLRVVKVVKTFLVSDTDWIQDTAHYDVCMALIVSANAIVMSFELDIVWSGWVYIDNCFLFIYFSEMSLRIKRWGFHFFTHTTDWGWNWLDFGIVSAGMLDLWLIPGIEMFRKEVMGGGGESAIKKEGASIHDIMSLVRLTRLMRVLRLVRVLRSIPPLYTLLVGVIDAFRAMQWVIVLTLLTLYGGAIVFTNLIGKGMIYPDHEAPGEALERFGTMARSLFSLFELMNGDTSVIKSITDQMAGKFMFACFMVISNWAVLAILTAVVSENMIASSNRFSEEERERTELKNVESSKQRLLEIFEANDDNKNGSINREEFADMLNDEATFMELSEGSHMRRGDLLDLFDCLSVEEQDGGSKINVSYRDLIHSLKANTTVADKRSVLHVMIRMRALQDQVTTQIDSKFGEMQSMMSRIETHVKGEGASL